MLHVVCYPTSQYPCRRRGLPPRRQGPEMWRQDTAAPGRPFAQLSCARFLHRDVARPDCMAAPANGRLGPSIGGRSVRPRPPRKGCAHPCRLHHLTVSFGQHNSGAHNAQEYAQDYNVPSCRQVVTRLCYRLQPWRYFRRRNWFASASLVIFIFFRSHSMRPPAARATLPSSTISVKGPE